MLSNIFSRGSGQRTFWRVGTLIMLLGLVAALFSTGTSQAAQPAQTGACDQPGNATIIDPTGGAVQVRMYFGSNTGTLENFPTSIQRIALNSGQVVYGYCVDSLEARLTGVTVCLLAPISDVRLSYLIAKYPPTPGDRIAQAARQAAVWHFSNGNNLNLADPTTEGPAVDDAVVAQYTALLNEINAIDPNNPPAILRPGPLAMAIDPVSAINELPLQSSHQITVTLTKGGFPLPGISVQVASSFGQFSQAQGTTDANGQAKFTVSSTVAGTASITATAVVTVPQSLEYVVQQNPTALQPFGIPSNTVETLTANASKEWRTTSTPTPTATPTNTPTPTATPTDTPTNTPTATATSTPTDTPTNTPTPTSTPVVTNTPTSTPTATSTPTNTPTNTPTPIFTPTSTPTATPTTPAQSASIALTKVITSTKEDDWAFVFQLSRLDGGDEGARVVTKAVPSTRWDNLTPGTTYVLSEQTPGAPWIQGDFACEVGGQPTGIVEPNGPITLTVNAGDSVLCRKDNVDMSGTNIDEGQEPGGLNKKLFLPLINP